jgi:glutamine cyclotransferase
MIEGKMPYDQSFKGPARGRSRSARQVGLTVTTVANDSSSVDLEEATVDPVFMGGSGDKEADGSDNPKARCCKKCSLRSYKKFCGIGIVLFLIFDAVLLYVFLAPRNNNKTGDSSSVIVDPTNDSTDDYSEDDLYATETMVPTTAETVTTDEPQIENNSPTLDPSFSTNIFDRVMGTENGRFELLQSVPHDANAFTQGLEVLSHQKIEIMNGLATSSSISVDQLTITPETFLSSYTLESTGRTGKSTLRIVELATGKVVQQLELGDAYFGEGCTYYYEPNDNYDSAGGVVRVVQITFKEGRGFVYDLSIPTTTTPQWSLSLIGDFEFSSDTFNGQGWGIVYNPLRNQFIVSDGSNFLHFWELTERLTFSFTETGTVTTFDFDLVERVKVRESRTVTLPANWTRVRRINELEWDPYSYGGNTILANIWKTNEILRIWVGLPEEDNNNNNDDDNNIFIDDSGSNSKNHPINVGRVTHVYDLSELEVLANPSRNGAVLNGIAFVYESSTASSALPHDSVEELISKSANQFWVTGKYWPSMFRIRLIDE